MKTSIVQTILALLFVAAPMTHASAAGADSAIAEWNQEWNGFHSSDTSGPDWMTPRLNLMYRVPDRRLSSIQGAGHGDSGHLDALARFAAQIESIIAGAFDSHGHGPPALNIFVFVEGKRWRLPDRDWAQVRAEICAPPTEPDGPTIPEPFTVSAILGLGVGATVLLRRVRERSRVK